MPRRHTVSRSLTTSRWDWPFIRMAVGDWFRFPIEDADPRRVQQKVGGQAYHIARRHGWKFTTTRSDPFIICTRTV